MSSSQYSSSRSRRSVQASQISPRRIRPLFGTSEKSSYGEGVDMNMHSLEGSLPTVDLSLWLRRGQPSSHESGSSAMNANDYSNRNINNDAQRRDLKLNRIGVITNNNLKLFSRVVDETAWLFPKEM